MEDKYLIPTKVEVLLVGSAIALYALLLTSIKLALDVYQLIRNKK